MRKVIFHTSILFVLYGAAYAQDLGSTLGKVASQYGQAYIAPAANAFGVDLNSGLFHTASVGGALPFGLNLYVGLQVSGAFVPSSDKSFSLTYRDTLNYSGYGMSLHVPATITATNVPTIFGSKAQGHVTFHMSDTLTIGPSRILVDSTGTIETVGGLVNASIAPVPVPQIGLGSLFGTDVMVRWLPKIKYGNYGSIQLFGWGLRHSVSQYIPLIPVDIAVQIGFQNFAIKDSAGGDLLKTSTFAANVEVSKTFAIVTFYGGLQLESSNTDVSYIYTPSYSGARPIPVSFSVKGKNNFRALVGLNLWLGGLTINADYNFGTVSAVTAGLGVTI
jgi:hypothetical protein